MVLALSLFAPAGADEPDAALHDGLREVKAALERAMNARDIEGIVAHAHPDVVFTTMNGDVARGRDGVRQYFATMMTAPGHLVDEIEAHFDADDLSILHGGDAAVSWGTSTGRYSLTDGTAFDVDARWSATLVRQDQRWVVASFHYSTDMWDNPVLAGTRRALTVAGVVGAVITGLLGAGIGFFVGRRR